MCIVSSCWGLRDKKKKEEKEKRLSWPHVFLVKRTSQCEHSYLSIVSIWHPIIFKHVKERRKNSFDKPIEIEVAMPKSDSQEEARAEQLSSHQPNHRPPLLRATIISICSPKAIDTRIRFNWFEWEGPRTPSTNKSGSIIGCLNQRLRSLLLQLSILNSPSISVIRFKILQAITSLSFTIKHSIPNKIPSRETERETLGKGWLSFQSAFS